jgi:hypothetical protein
MPLSGPASLVHPLHCQWMRQAACRLCIDQAGWPSRAVVMGFASIIRILCYCVVTGEELTDGSRSNGRGRGTV